MRPRSFLIVLALTAVALAVAADAGAVETRMPFTQMFTNPCTGEALVATGTLIFREEVNVGPSGQSHERSYMSFHGTSATAPVSGRKYVVQEQTLEGTNSDVDGAPSTTHFKIKVHWVRTGDTGALIDDDDFYDWFHLHLTVNSNGMPTSLKIDTEDDVCR